MSLHAKLPDVFSEDVTSLDDYKNRIQEIEKYCKSNGDDNWGTFYRGDLYDAKAQCNLFRSNSTTNEAELFNTWKNTHSKICEDFPEEFMQLAYMQHYCKKEDALYTRLLDFSTDSLVALRFACGEGENRRKKVTVYQTDYLRLNAIDRKEILESYMRLVKSQESLPLYKESQDEACWSRDTFVEVERNFPRIDRQKGLFLIMGNFTTAELLGEQDPEGTGYRARTRFSKFFNLPELMNLFKEVADIKTADQLNLPTPEVEYHNIVAQPTEHQQEMVKALSERASEVHRGSVDPSVDNMLKITSDGRKLGLDQRIVNQMLPDEPGTKVNQCVDNIMQIWRDGDADKLTQLVFCDISTPQAAPSKKAAKQLDNPLLHGLEEAIPLDEPEPAFTIYEDIRQKLIAQGMPAEQIAFIHEANTEVRKKELFSKVRTGQVRVLLGSTAKMGAGTNVQDRLVALHDLDCPWRPGDLAQRKGRIERQGNQNPLVHVYRYVTEGTFDAYLWQTVENKQKFISQIMTSKSPVRSCDDVDETALSFAEIKALCAGDPRIKERMDLDVEVAKLKLMKADHQSKQYRLEDQLLKYFPQEIETNKGYIQGFEADLETLAAHPHPADGFAGMEIRGDLLTDKENAGAALLDACKEVKTSDPVQIGSYRGYAMSVEFSAWKQEYTLLLKGQMTHRATLGTDPRGNLTRIDNALAQMPQRLEAVKNQLENLYQQQAAAKEEVGKPFPFEDDLRVKSARLVELDTLLNIDGKGQAHAEAVVAKSTRTSVLDSLKRPVPPRSPEKKPKQHEEVR